MAAQPPFALSEGRQGRCHQVEQAMPKTHGSFGNYASDPPEGKYDNIDIEYTILYFKSDLFD